MSENHMSSDVFEGYRRGSLVENGLRNYISNNLVM